MTISISKVLIGVAAILFFVAAVGVGSLGAVGLVPLGLFFLALGLIV